MTVHDAMASASIAGLPQEATERILALLAEQSLHPTGGMATDMGLAELLVLGAPLDDLLLPWQIDLQLRHLIRHPELLGHIDRAGITLHP